jgi:chromosome segregation ATPase
MKRLRLCKCNGLPCRRLEKEQALKVTEQKLEDIKNNLKSTNKKASELQNAEVLTKWKFVNYETKIDALKLHEKELIEQIKDLKKSINLQNSKILSNIHVQEEITEEMNSYKARYEKQQKDIQDSRKEVLRYKNNLSMVNQSLSRVTSECKALEERLNTSQKENVLREMNDQIDALKKQLEEAQKEKEKMAKKSE